MCISLRKKAFNVDQESWLVQRLTAILHPRYRCSAEAMDREIVKLIADIQAELPPPAEDVDEDGKAA